MMQRLALSIVLTYCAYIDCVNTLRKRKDLGLF